MNVCFFYRADKKRTHLSIRQSPLGAKGDPQKDIERKRWLACCNVKRKSNNRTAIRTLSPVTSSNLNPASPGYSRSYNRIKLAHCGNRLILLFCGLEIIFKLQMFDCKKLHSKYQPSVWSELQRWINLVIRLTSRFLRFTLVSVNYSLRVMFFITYLTIVSVYLLLYRVMFILALK